MLIHPDIHLEIARQRYQDLRADAQRHRIGRSRDDVSGRSPTRGKPARQQIAREGSSRADWRCERVLTTDHFGHREAVGLVVDLFWTRRNLEDEFRVEVKDEREGARFVLHPRTGREAIRAFYHPFSAASTAQRPRVRAR